MSKNIKTDCSIASVKKYCENNNDFIKILELFSDGYIPTYNKWKVKIREDIQPFLKRNFFIWYYSEANYVSDVSPARFISSQIHYKFGEDFVVIPIPEPVYKKSRLQSINYSFHIFTMDDHPLVKDIESLTEAIIKTETYEQLIKQVDFKFGKSHYLSFLLNICGKMGLFTPNAEMYKINERKLAAFLALSARDKLHKMLSTHLSSLLSNLKEHKLLRKLPTQAKLLKILETSQDMDSFYAEAFPGLVPLVDDFISSSGIMDFGHLEVFDEDGSPLEEMMESTMEIQALVSLISSAIFICCGLYFQIIEPEYDSYFDFNELDKDYVASLPPVDSELDKNEAAQYKSMMSYLAYIKPPSVYSVTPIGAKLFGKNYVDGLFYMLIEPDEYDDVLEDMLLDRDEIEVENDMALQLELFDDDFLTFYDTANEILMQKKGNILQFPSPQSPLDGLNPDNKPTFTDETATYRFKVNKQVITIDGNETLTDLGYIIESMFDLDGDHLSSFYMGKKFFEESREIRCPVPFSVSGESDNYRICDLNLFKGQTFLYLYDFGTEHRFTLKFDGYV